MKSASNYSFSYIFCRFLLLSAILFQGACGSSSSDDFTADTWAPEERTDGWKVAKSQNAGFDNDKLSQLTRDITNGEYSNTHAVLIEYDGSLVYEKYFDGTDERWGTSLDFREMSYDSLHDLRSISKSVTSALLGIAITGDIDSELSNPIPSYFPTATVGAGYASVTLHHMLTMTAGVEWNEMTVPYTDASNDEIRLYQSAVTDPVAFVLERSVIDTPGTVWYYNGGLSQVLAGVVQELSGQSMVTYADENLFQPLGITDFEWLGGDSWDPAMPSAASGLRLTARDLAKIGSLYLHGGQWEGQQVIPKNWVERSMQRHVEQLSGGWDAGGIYGYGYQWWHGRFPEGYTAIAGVGNGNQRLFILPEERIVVTIFAGEYNKPSFSSEDILRQIMAAR